MVTILGKKYHFSKLGRVYSLDAQWVKNFDGIALLLMVKAIHAFLCFCIFVKNSKWLSFFGRRGNWDNWAEYLA